MLTKDELEQIGKVIDTRLDAKLAPIKEQLAEQGKGIKTIKKSNNKIRKDVNVMLDMLNREDMQLHHRVKRIEDHLNLPQTE